MERILVAEVAKIYGLWNEYASSWSAGDMAHWIALWAEDAVQMLPHTARNKGRDQIRMAMQPFMDKNDYDLTISPDEIRVLGSRAYTHGNYRIKITPKVEGETIVGSGNFLTILMKQIDGTWKIAVDCFNCISPSHTIWGGISSA